MPPTTTTCHYSNPRVATVESMHQNENTQHAPDNWYTWQVLPHKWWPQWKTCTNMKTCNTHRTMDIHDKSCHTNGGYNGKHALKWKHAPDNGYTKLNFSPKTYKLLSKTVGITVGYCTKYSTPYTKYSNLPNRIPHGANTTPLRLNTVIQKVTVQNTVPLYKNTVTFLIEYPTTKVNVHSIPKESTYLPKNLPIYQRIYIST